MQHAKKWKRQMTGFVKLVILLGMGCFGVVVQADMVYVANSGSNTVSVIDTSINSVMATVPVGEYPLGIVINSSGTRVYVSNYRSDSISVIDTGTNSVINTVVVGRSPYGVAINSSGTRVYVANRDSDNVSVIDTSTNTVIATVTTGTGEIFSLWGIAINPSGKYIYVTKHKQSDTSANSVSVIDTMTNSVVDTVAVGNGSEGLEVSPDGTHVYVANPYSDNISVIDTSNNKVVSTIAVGHYPKDVAISPDGIYLYVVHSIYVVDPADINVYVIDTRNNTIVATMAAGHSPSSVAINSSGTRIYTANSWSDNVSVIDTSTNSVIATVKIAAPIGEVSYPQGLAIVGSTSTPSTPNLSTLGSGKAISPIGLPTNTNASFAGGASIDGNSYQTYLTTSPSSNLTVKGRITVDPADVGKQADLLYVAGFENQTPFDGGADTAYFTMDESGNFYTVDLYTAPSVWMNQLATKPFKRNVTLQQEMVMDEVNAGQLLTKPGVNYYFMGYRLQNGTLVYTSVPIIVNMQ